MRNVRKLVEGIDLFFRLFRSRILRIRLLYGCKRRIERVFFVIKFLRFIFGVE